jgi:hypothetical protein
VSPNVLGSSKITAARTPRCVRDCIAVSQLSSVAAVITMSVV